MTVASPLPRRRAALIYAATVVATYSALAVCLGVSGLMHVPLLAEVAIYTWWVLFAGPGMLVAALALSTGHAAVAQFFWPMVVCSVAITLLPVYFIAFPSTKYTRAHAMACQALWSGLGWIAYVVMSRVFPVGGA